MAMVLRVLGCRTILHLRGGRLDFFFGRSRLGKWWRRAAFCFVDRIFVLYRDILDRGRQLYGDKVMYVPNMIDDEFVAGAEAEAARHPLRREGPYRLLQVAWQSPEKGSTDIVEAVARAESSVEVDLVGDAADENERLIEGLIESLGLGDCVHMRGILRGDALMKSFGEADVFLLPSQAEGFPNTIMEAMAFGLPIVATDVGNIREMVGFDTDDPAGIILKNVNPVDPDELAAAIDRLLADPELRRRMSAAGQRRVREHYLASKVVPRLIQTCEEIAERTEVKDRWAIRD
jgi:glycosyltransferase involved in cell wall biosynthesis